MKEGLGQMEKYVRAEVAFHDVITKAARSTVLQGIMESLRDLLLEGRTKITGDQTGKKNLDFHTSIYEAIRARNPDLARRRMRAHVQDSRKRYETFYQKLKVPSIVPSRQLAGVALQTDKDVGEQSHRPSGRRSRSN
jgi:DNA-binding FadR family transcriptional regulator